MLCDILSKKEKVIGCGGPLTSTAKLIYIHACAYRLSETDENMIVDLRVPQDPPGTNIAYSPPYLENSVIVFSTPFGKFKKHCDFLL